jgi:hypothetical protein
MPEQLIRIEFSYIESEYTEARRWIVFRTNPNLAPWMCLAVVAIVCGPMVVLSSYPTNQMGIIVGIITAGAGLGSAYKLAATFWDVYFGDRSWFESIRGPLELQFDEANFVLRGPKETSQAPWQTFKAVFETRSLYLLFQIPSECIMIPKRVLAPEHLSFFKQASNRGSRISLAASACCKQGILDYADDRGVPGSRWLGVSASTERELSIWVTSFNELVWL